MGLEIECKVIAGTEILDAVKEAKRVSLLLNVLVTFDFNGISVTVSPTANPERVETEYRKAFEENRKFIIV